MKRHSARALTALLAVALLSARAPAREPARGAPLLERSWSPDRYPALADPGLRGLHTEAAVDTYCIVWYDFEMMNWQGWTQVDKTAQPDTFFHVDDFAGLGGGAFGRLVAIEGTKSMWCGARANASDPYMCSWRRAPGYGNSWEQTLSTVSIAFAGAITFSYRLVYDSEPDYDYTYVEYDMGSGDWRVLAAYDSYGDTTAQHFIPLAKARTKLRFRFASDGAWSDEDGLWNSDGACIVDELRVRDAAALDDFQDFESCPVGAHTAGIWRALPKPGYGMYSGLRNNLLDRDPCGENVATQIVFWVGSGYPHPSYPWQYVTPFCKGTGGIEAPCQNESVFSPYIDMTKYSTNCDEVQDGVIPPGDLPQLGGCHLRFTVYRDLPLQNLVFYHWGVRKIIGGCPAKWQDIGFVNYGAEGEYIQSSYDVSGFLAGNDPVQIELGIIDMCDVWYLINGNCAEHTTAPYFDNVRLYRYKTSGPLWVYRDIDLFQDNFPENELDIESFVRADAAKDVAGRSNPAVRPGDSIVVSVDSPLGGGIAEDPALGGPAVYLHAKCTYIGPAPVKPPLAGPALAGSVETGGVPGTIVFNYVSDDCVWTRIQCETARTAGGEVLGRYMVDLNDELFTRGYMIEYYFTAKDASGVESALPRYARSGPPYFEWTCLPSLGSDILFVDDCTGRGSFAGTVEDYWMPAFDAVFAPPNNKVDKYDVNGPTSGVSNGPGSRAKSQQLSDAYCTIVWDSGDLGSITISEGTSHSDKSDDCRMLVDWMNLSEHHCGLWVCGDGAASDLAGSTAPAALELMSEWCGADLAGSSFFELSGGRLGGGVVNPLVSGNPEGGTFVHAGVPDRFYLWGGCPVINAYDALEKTGSGLYALDYPDYQGTVYHAGIQSSRTNAGGHTVRTMWFGFSLQSLRDDAPGAPIDRFEIVRDAAQWLQSGASNVDITDAEAPRAYRLAQNFPNPFNPSTTIRYDMRSKGIVTIKIFDVSGRLVRTLVDGMKDAGSWSAVWDGRNNLGADAASGIYLCKMESAGFGATRKLVLLR